MKHLERLAKWRAIFAGWQLGTRAKGDPEGDAVRDHREITILLRAEVSAVIGLLVEKRVFTGDEFFAAVETEAVHLAKDYEHRFPGMRATDVGIEVYDSEVAAKTMKGWKP